MLVQTAPTASNWLSVQQQLHRRSIVVFRNDSLRSTRCLVPSGFMWAEFSKCLPTLPQKEPGAAFQQQELQRDGVLSSNKKQKSQQLQSVRPLPQCLGKITQSSGRMTRTGGWQKPHNSFLRQNAASQTGFSFVFAVHTAPCRRKVKEISWLWIFFFSFGKVPEFLLPPKCHKMGKTLVKPPGKPRCSPWCDAVIKQLQEAEVQWPAVQVQVLNPSRCEKRDVTRPANQLTMQESVETKLEAQGFTGVRRGQQGSPGFTGANRVCQGSAGSTGFSRVHWGQQGLSGLGFY